MYKFFLFIVSGLIFSQNINQETGWSFIQSTDQAFYIFESIEVGGQVVIGDGATVQDEDESYCFQNANSCDVVGAFVNGVCIGWVYADSSGYTTVPAMGNIENYAEDGDLIDFKLYDASEGDYLDFDSNSMICLNSQTFQSVSCLWSNFSLVLVSNPNFLDNEEIPSDFNLLSAYPNPFNPSINIDFYIESNSLVNLKVYDILGNLIDTLIINDFIAIGSHSIVWEPNNISTGEYIISLVLDGDQIASQKIAYIK